MSVQQASAPPLSSHTSEDSLSSISGVNLVGDVSADGNIVLRRKPSANHQSNGHSLAKSEHRTSSSSSEEDYEHLQANPATVVRGSKGGHLSVAGDVEPSSYSSGQSGAYEEQRASSPKHRRRASIPVLLEKTDQKGEFKLTADDPDLRRMIKSGLKRRSRFSDLVFTRQFSTFDRFNPRTSSSPFHGFFTLFWLGKILLKFFFINSKHS